MSDNGYNVLLYGGLSLLFVSNFLLAYLIVATDMTLAVLRMLFVFVCNGRTHTFLFGHGWNKCSTTVID